MEQDFKDKLWQKIVTAKIYNQFLCLKYRGVDKKRCKEIYEIAGIVKTTGKSEKPQAKPNVQRETLWETAVFTRRPAPPRHG